MTVGRPTGIAAMVRTRTLLKNTVEIAFGCALVLDQEVDQNDEDKDNGDQDQKVSNTVDDLLEMTLLRGDGHETGSTTDEGIATGLGHNSHLLTVLDDRGRVNSGALVLGQRQRLSCQCGLIDLKIAFCSLAGGTDSEKMAVRWDNVTEMEYDHIARNKIRRIEFDQVSVAPAASLQSQRLFECIQGGIGLCLLGKFEGSVDEQQGQDDAKVGPVLWFARKSRDSKWWR